jgi:DNA repair protein RecO
MEAVVLSRRDVREFDQRIVLYGAGGKFECLARGIKKSTAKNSASLEPGSFISFTPAQGRQQSLITSVEPLAVFTDIFQNLNANLHVQFGLTVLERITEVEQSEPELFAALLEWLAQVNAAPVAATHLTLTFFAKLIMIFGFTPELEVCVQCGQALGEQTALSYAHGGFLCARCTQSAAADLALEPMSKNERLVFSSFFNASPTTVSSHEQRFLDILSRYMSYQTGRQLARLGHLAELCKV